MARAACDNIAADTPDGLVTDFSNIVPMLRLKFDLIGRNPLFLWNIFGNIGPLFIALFCIPYLYRHGTAEYLGYLTIIWAAIGYTGLFDFGLSRALHYFAACSKSDRTISLYGSILKSSLFSVTVSVVIAAIVLPFRDEILHNFKFGNADQARALTVIILSLPVFLVSNLVRASLEGLEQFRDANIFKFICYSSLFLCPSLLLFLGDTTLFHVCIFYAAVRLVAGFYAVLKLRPHIREGWTNGILRIPVPMQRIVAFGGWATVSSTISPLMVYGDRFVLAYFTGASSIAIYAILQEFIGKTILFSSSYVATFQPRMSYLAKSDAKALYRHETRNVIHLSIFIYLGSLLAAPFFVAVWLGVSIGEVALLSVVMSIGFFFNSVAQAPHAFLLARAQPRRVAYAHVVEALLYFPLLVVATMHYGVIGAALAGMARMIFDYGILTWQARRLIA